MMCSPFKLKSILNGLLNFEVWNLGRVTYDAAQRIQQYLAQLHNYQDQKISSKDYEKIPEGNGIESIKNTLLLMELSPVYTTGLRKGISKDEEEMLRTMGAEVRQTDRGGLITFHGPGQLTIYPVMNLRHFKPSVKWYVDRLEETGIQTLELYGIEGTRHVNTGVWVENRKIGAIGVHISRGVSTHGMCLNCCVDLRWFDYIDPCGLDKSLFGVTSLDCETGRAIDLSDFTDNFKRCFENVFDCRLIDMTKSDKLKIRDVLKQNV